ncbi:hypothetical protein [Streptomyces sp. NBC_00388]|uniref:hypothetical protein n=1 Tax=Streptomyces sp. NBC_00388 TaxID=2975735 RepID=UPI002E1A5225
MRQAAQQQGCAAFRGTGPGVHELAELGVAVIAAASEPVIAANGATQLFENPRRLRPRR